MIRFSIFGIPVEIQPFFWISLIILGGASYADSADAILKIGLFVLAGFISILIHELGHALTARAFGAYSAITLQAFGGYAAYSGGLLNRWQSFLVTAAGPGIQILLGVAVILLLPSPPELSGLGDYFLHTLIFIINEIFGQPSSNFGVYFFCILIFISFFWAILNLLPVVPLDGGQMLNALLGPARIKITLWVTIIVAVVAGVLMFTQTGSLIFPIFLGMFAWQAFQGLKQHP